MFTGLIEDVGVIKHWRRKNRSAILTVATHLPIRSLAPGASIAVNGTCLTVVRSGRGRFTVDVSPETASRTNLETLRAGSSVNLERPLRLQDRLGGHLVTGHVDGLATVQKISRQGDFTVFEFRVEPKIGSKLVAKGSVAVDGISLTVNDCGRLRFSVAIIPFTLQHTNLRARSLGDKVNIETDLLGKYVYQFLRQRRRSP